MLKNSYIFKIIGSLIGLISIYWLVKTGHHVIFYKSTGGLDTGVFGYPKEYWQILIVFIFWIVIFLGGLGIIWTNRIGLTIGLISMILIGITSITYFIFLSSQKFQYSTKLIIDGNEREMTLIEKWKIIYSEPVQYMLTSLLIIFVLILILKKLRLIKLDLKNTSPQQ